MDYISNLLLLQSTLLTLKENHPRRWGTGPEDPLMDQQLSRVVDDLVAREIESLDPVGFIWRYFGGHPNGDVKITRDGEDVVFSSAIIHTVEDIIDMVRGYPMAGSNYDLVLDIDPRDIGVFIVAGRILAAVNAERYIDIIRKQQ